VATRSIVEGGRPAWFPRDVGGDRVFPFFEAYVFSGLRLSGA